MSRLPDDLRERLWPADTFVDFDAGLSSAVKKLRDELEDSSDIHASSRWFRATATG